MDRIVLYLSGARGLCVLRNIVEAGHGILRVVAPEKSGDLMTIKSVCQDLNVRLQKVNDVNAPRFVGELAAASPILGIIGGFPTIFGSELIALPQMGTINLHAGRLPEYRGGSPLNWQIINGETTAGLSIIEVDEGIDTGDILAATEIPIGPNDTIACLHERANAIFGRLTVDVISSLERRDLVRSKQDSSRATYWHQRNEEDGRIHWNYQTACDVHNLVRGLTRPYPGSYCYYADRVVRIFATEVPEERIKGVTGRVCWIQKRGPYVVCADRAVLLTDYTIEGDETARLRHGVHLY